MCSICGCSGTNHAHHDHAHEPGHGHTGDHSHTDDHNHDNNHDNNHDHNHDHQRRLVRIERDLLASNAVYAQRNRQKLQAQGTLALNLMSSPGSGKTTLLVETIRRLGTKTPIAVIEGDQCTSNDADRIRSTGAPALQINTGKGCHLDAHGVGHAIDELALQPNGYLFIENVGNLVCPAGFDLGEAHKVVILSVTEGEDKPLKYADMFAASDLMILNKSDLLPYVNFNVALCIEYAHRVNPKLQVLTLSATSGDGMDAWLHWLSGELKLQTSI